MSYYLAIDTLVWLYLGFILSVLFGGLLPLHWPHLAWLHLPTVVWGCAVKFLDLPCPLISLENRLRRTAGGTGCSGGSIEHCLLPLAYPAGLTPAVQWVPGAVALLVNLIVYLYLWHRRSSH